MQKQQNWSMLKKTPKKKDGGIQMEKVTLFSHILPEEQERMWVCFQMREVVYENNEIIMEYTNTMKKIGLTRRDRLLYMAAMRRAISI